MIFRPSIEAAMKRTIFLLSLVMLVGLLVLSACGGGARPGQTSNPSPSTQGNSSQAPAISSSNDLDQQLNEIEQSLNNLETSLNAMPALPDVK